MTQKNIHKIFIPQQILIFLRTPKNIEIQNFEPKKMTRAYLHVYVKISEYPPPPPPGERYWQIFDCDKFIWKQVTF